MTSKKEVNQKKNAEDLSKSIASEGRTLELTVLLSLIVMDLFTY